MTMEFDQEHARQLASLQARMNRIEALMQQLLTTLTTSQSNMGQVTQLQMLLQELRSSPDVQARNMSAMSPGGAAQPHPERPEMAAIRQALLAGDKVKAIQLYRNLYGVGLKEAQTALEAL
jgi:ribosomal protein L7/L12